MRQESETQMTFVLNQTEKAYCAEVADRIARGNAAFEATLQRFGGITADEAAKAREWMAKKKLTKRDLWTGIINVKHGAYLDKPVIRNIVVEASKPKKSKK